MALELRTGIVADEELSTGANKSSGVGIGRRVGPVAATAGSERDQGGRQGDREGRTAAAPGRRGRVPVDGRCTAGMSRSRSRPRCGGPRHRSAARSKRTVWRASAFLSMAGTRLARSVGPRGEDPLPRIGILSHLGTQISNRWDIIPISHRTRSVPFRPGRPWLIRRSYRCLLRPPRRPQSAVHRVGARRLARPRRSCRRLALGSCRIEARTGIRVDVGSAAASGHLRASPATPVPPPGRRRPRRQSSGSPACSNRLRASPSTAVSSSRADRQPEARPGPVGDDRFDPQPSDGHQPVGARRCIAGPAPGRPPPRSDSRLAVMTGVHRKDLRRIRTTGSTARAHSRSDRRRGVCSLAVRPAVSHYSRSSKGPEPAGG